jgi:hypothetical protein
VHSIRAMKGIRFFIYFGRIFSTYETEDGPVKGIKHYFSIGIQIL